jgi:hypothetical protein
MISIIKNCFSIRNSLKTIANIFGEENYSTITTEVFSELQIEIEVGNILQNFIIINKVFYDAITEKTSLNEIKNNLKNAKKILIEIDRSALNILIEIFKIGFINTEKNKEKMNMILKKFNAFIKLQNQICEIHKVIEFKIEKKEIEKLQIRA